MLNAERRTITTEQEVIISGNCDNCGMVLTPVAGIQDGIWQGHGAVHAMRIMLSYGYGEYFDDPYAKTNYVFCKDCVDKLLAAFPCMNHGISHKES